MQFYRAKGCPFPQAARRIALEILVPNEAFEAGSGRTLGDIRKIAVEDCGMRLCSRMDLIR